MGARALVVWSDKPGTSSFRSFKPGTDMAGAGDVVRQVQSLPALVSTFVQLRNQLPLTQPSRRVVAPGQAPAPDEPADPQSSSLREAQYHSLIFNTHGSTGLMHLGADEVTAKQVRSELGGKGFEGLLAPNATVSFQGCNIAEGPRGELFLATAGEVFLKTGGGIVKGNTGTGWAAPLLGSTRGFYPLGEWISARVASGGTVTFLNPKHLQMGLISKRFEKGEAQINSIEQEKQADAKTIDLLRTRLSSARKYVGGATLSFQSMEDTCEQLDALEADLSKYASWASKHKWTD